ncbi:MAG TPA: hypothetical protein VG009_05275 [Candidatus Dormibacteraeota bacterium]|jgi:hypothetical protein|nr:hypothetical protein [Candidatus Dormibacteraeota bacterium]
MKCEQPECVTRDDASTHQVPDIDIPAAEDAVRSLLVALARDLFQWCVPSGGVIVAVS